MEDGVFPFSNHNAHEESKQENKAQRVVWKVFVQRIQNHHSWREIRWQKRKLGNSLAEAKSSHWPWCRNTPVFEGLGIYVEKEAGR
ncbi:hypothetical protein LEMLEM_LOCUS22447 [Lemmus lemmus]